MPWIIEFGAATPDGKEFKSMVTPGSLDFHIHPDATEINGWNRKKLLALPVAERPTFDKVWKNFLKWMREDGKINPQQNICLSAYNGFGFDFRVILNNLRYFGVSWKKEYILVDPWLDMRILEKKNLKLDDAFRGIQTHAHDHYTHAASTDVNKLRKLTLARALYHQSLVIRSGDYQNML